jgi:hypothetical protein
MQVHKGSASRLPISVRIGLTVLGGIGLAGIASANTIHVCTTCAHTTIQTAVNDAVSGDTINIAAGRYTENVAIAGKALTLVGQSAGSTLVYGSTATSPVFTLGSAVATDTPLLITIQGLTISHGSHTGGTGVGGGVQVRSGSYLHIANSTITENNAITGGGIGINSPGAPVTTITACLIAGNFAQTVSPGGPGGGVLVATGSTVSIQKSSITGNSAVNGGGIYQYIGSTLSVAGTTVSGNSASAVERDLGPAGGGGGGLESHGTLIIDSSYILNNIANGEDGGGGIAFYAPTTTSVVTVSNTIVAQNGGDGVDANGGTLVLNNSYVVQNAGYGVLGSATLSATGSTVKDNQVGNTCVANDCTQ